MDGMQLPYVARCLRAEVLDRPRGAGGETDQGEPHHGNDVGGGDGGDEPPSDGPDDDMLLIDFR
jgi:hypothetical protein